MDIGARTVWAVFIRSFNAAIYDIREDKRGMLFQRLIEHGLPNPDDPEIQFSDSRTTLSDPALGHKYSCSRVEMREVEDYRLS